MCVCVSVVFGGGCHFSLLTSAHRKKKWNITPVEQPFNMNKNIETSHKKWKRSYISNIFFRFFSFFLFWTGKFVHLIFCVAMYARVSISFSVLHVFFCFSVCCFWIRLYVYVSVSHRFVYFFLSQILQSFFFTWLFFHVAQDFGSKSSLYYLNLYYMPLSSQRFSYFDPILGQPKYMYIYR